MALRPSAGSLLVCLVLGCGDSSGPPTVDGATYIQIGMSYVFLSPGFSVQFRPSLFDASGARIQVPSSDIFQWSSEDPSVVSISDDGVATAKGALGQGINITVRYDSLHSTATVYTRAPPDSIGMTPSPIVFTPGASLPVYGLAWGILGPQNNHFFRFSSSNPGAFDLEDHGCYTPPGCTIESPNVTLLHGLAIGSGTITVRTTGMSLSVPVEVRTIDFVPSTVTAGGNHTCAYSTDNVFFCWGGDVSRTPLAADIPAGLTSIQAGTDFQPGLESTCGIDGNGLIQCWRWNLQPLLPTPLSTTIHFTSLAMGSVSSCGIDTNGAAWCWGENGWGQLGNGTKTPSATPVQVSGGLTFSKLAINGEHACGITTTGEAWCWGANYVGQLGSPGVVQGCGSYDCSTVPVAVTGGHTFNAITVGIYHSCAIDTSQAAWCWGSSDRRGNGGTPTSEPSEVVPVSGSHSWVQLSAAGAHTCGITTANLGYCWGSNSNGQAGQDPAITQGPFLAPTLIIGGHQFTAIETGGQYTCAFATDGLYCFGDNSYGQIGTLQQNTGTPGKVNGQE